MESPIYTSKRCCFIAASSSICCCLHAHCLCQIRQLTFLHSRLIWQVYCSLWSQGSVTWAFYSSSVYVLTGCVTYVCASIHLARTICPSLSSIFMHWQIHQSRRMHICLIWSEANPVLSKPKCTAPSYMHLIWIDLIFCSNISKIFPFSRYGSLFADLWCGLHSGEVDLPAVGNTC